MKTLLQIILQEKKRTKGSQNKEIIVQCERRVWNVQLNMASILRKLGRVKILFLKKKKKTSDSHVQYLTQVNVRCYTNVQNYQMIMFVQGKRIHTVTRLFNYGHKNRNFERKSDANSKWAITWQIYSFKKNVHKFYNVTSWEELTIHWYISSYFYFILHYLDLQYTICKTVD